MTNKYLLISALIGCTKLLLAQAPVLDKSSILSPGDAVASYIVNSSTLAKPGPAGENLSWDFSYLPKDFGYSFNCVKAEGTPLASRFPTSTMVHKMPFEESNFYFTLKEDGWYGDNMIYSYYDNGPNGREDFYFSFPIHPKVPLLKFPTTYGSQWDVSTSGSEVQFGRSIVDSIRVSYTQKKKSTFDAWGAIKTPFKQYASALRQVDYSESATTLETKKDGKWTVSSLSESSKDTAYRWWVKGVKLPVLELVRNPIDKNYSAYFYKVTEPLGVEENFLSEPSIFVYPHPAKEDFFVQGATLIERICNNEGQDVPFSTNATANGAQVHVPRAKAGLYMMKLRRGDQVSVIKVAIAE